jgi:protocatechuate 3,4-dioxygenase, alpha subunit
MRGPTPSQTVGPYFGIGLNRLFSDVLAPTSTEGQAITISGQLLDGDGEPIPDAVFEFWQADHDGNYCCLDRSTGPPASFQGWRRVATDPEGRFTLHTIKPGSVKQVGRPPQAPHINVTLFMRGLLRHLYTRIYFDDELANQADQVLQAVPKQRRHTLLAKLTDQAGHHYRWNVFMQGSDETAFFDW